MISALLLTLALGADPTPATRKLEAKLEGNTTAIAGSLAEIRFSTVGVKEWKFALKPKPDWMRSFYDKDKQEVTVIAHSRKPATYAARLTASSPTGQLAEDEMEVEFLSPVNTTPVAQPTIMPHVMPAEAAAEPLDPTMVFTHRTLRNLVKDEPDLKPQLIKEAQIVADVMRAGRAMVVEHRIETPEELERYTATNCYNKLGPQSWEQIWKPEFFDLYRRHLDELLAAGQLTIMGHYEETWLEAAKGLEKFAGK